MKILFNNNFLKELQIKLILFSMILTIINNIIKFQTRKSKYFVQMKLKRWMTNIKNIINKLFLNYEIFKYLYNIYIF